MARKKKKHIGCLGTLTVFLVIIGGCIGVYLIRNPPDLDAIREDIRRSKQAEDERKANMRDAGIVVRSLNIKQVGDNYRYFFQIRNESGVSFSGDVTISLKREDGGSGWFETFSTDSPMVPGGETFVYTDSNTGPTDEFGEFKYVQFEATASANDKTAESRNQGRLSLTAVPPRMRKSVTKSGNKVSKDVVSDLPLTKEQIEEKADNKLKLAKNISRTNSSLSERWLKEITTEFPGTQAALEAEKLLSEN